MPTGIRKITIIGLTGALVVISAIITVVSLGPKAKMAAHAESVATASPHGGSSVQASPKSSPKTSPVTTVSPAHVTSSKTACTVLTSQIAGQILGGNPSQTTPSVSSSQTADVSVSACAYGQLQLVAHFPRTALGESKNDLVFGSERPAGVTPVNGLGQSAFWDPSSNQLNVLASNNWYIITWENQNQSQIQKAAETMARNF